MAAFFGAAFFLAAFFGAAFLAAFFGAAFFLAAFLAAFLGAAFFLAAFLAAFFFGFGAAFSIPEFAGFAGRLSRAALSSSPMLTFLLLASLTRAFFCLRGKRTEI